MHSKAVFSTCWTAPFLGFRDNGRSQALTSPVCAERRCGKGRGNTLTVRVEGRRFGSQKETFPSQFHQVKARDCFPWPPSERKMMDLSHCCVWCLRARRFIPQTHGQVGRGQECSDKWPESSEMRFCSSASLWRFGRMKDYGKIHQVGVFPPDEWAWRQTLWGNVDRNETQTEANAGGARGHTCCPEGRRFSAVPCSPLPLGPWRCSTPEAAVWTPRAQILSLLNPRGISGHLVEFNVWQTQGRGRPAGSSDACAAWSFST